MGAQNNDSFNIKVAVLALFSGLNNAAACRLF